MSGLRLEDFGPRSAPLQRAPAGAADPQDTRFDDGYNAGWDDAMSQVETEQTAASETLRERVSELRIDRGAAMAAALRSLEPILRDVFDKVLPRAAERSFLPTLMEELGDVLNDDVAKLSVVVSPEDATRLLRLLARSGLDDGRVSVRAEPALSLSQALIRWEDGERRLDFETVLSDLDEALDTFLSTLDREDAADSPSQEAANG